MCDKHTMRCVAPHLLRQLRRSDRLGSVHAAFSHAHRARDRRCGRIQAMPNNDASADDVTTVHMIIVWSSTGHYLVVDFVVCVHQVQSPELFIRCRKCECMGVCPFRDERKPTEINI